MTMAGKAAEIIKWGEESVSNGPSGDIQQASSLARAMVMRWGMSEKVGNLDYSEADSGYTGRTGGFSVSADTKVLIEQEVRQLIDDAYEVARKIILDNKKEFERLALGLLEYETLTGEDIKRVMRGEKPGDDDDGMNKPVAPPTVVPGVPKTTRKKRTPRGGGGMEPEPTG
jgi:cell division protease FtsH